MLNDTLSFFDRIRIEGNPVANPASLVVSGQARFTVLTPRLIRLEWASNGQFEDRATFAFPNRAADVPSFSAVKGESTLEIKTDALALTYRDDSKPFHADNLSITLEINGQTVTWTPGTPNPGNLHGTRRTLDQCADAADLGDGLLSRDGWTLFDDSNAFIWTENKEWVEGRADEHQQDWYFFGYGQAYKTQLKDYIQFGGDIPLVPRYVLGAWWSRFWAYHADDLKALVNDFESHEIPLDVLVVDMDWHTPDAWTGYTWNRELFPDPEGFLAWVHAQHLYVTLNLHPAEGVQKHEAIYPEFARRMGHDTSSGKAIAFDSVDQNFVQNYFALLHHPMEEQGVDFWWVDWQQGEASSIKNLDPLPWLNHLHFRDSARRGTRPMLYSRWGGLGNHRYPIGFSGDAYTTWESLAFQPYFTATAANVCYGWWSHDIGGHFGEADAELYARWVQFGAVNPCLRLHSTKDPLAERRPWAFNADVSKAAKAAFQFRYQLLPYLYSTASSASKNGLSLCYPMYYEYPNSEDAYLARGQYFLGNQLIAAPIVSPADRETGLAAFDVWIPEGTWYDYTTLETFSGPRWVKLYGDLDAIPLFAKAGAIVPLAPSIMRTQDYDGSHTILNLFPGTSGSFELYEDEGNTEAYKQGEYERTPITLASQNGQEIVVSIGAAEGNCPGLPARRSFEVHLRGAGQAEKVTVNGSEHSDWSCDATTGDLVIFVRDADRKTAVEIGVKPQSVWGAMKPELNTSSESAPFIHVVDYVTFEDAQHGLCTILIAPPADQSAFDVQVEWKLEKAGKTTLVPLTLKGCKTEQIIPCPFRDAGDRHTFQWNVSVNIAWQGKTLPYSYQSAVAYPAVTQWQSLIYNTEKQTFAPPELASGNVGAKSEWLDTRQPLRDNLKQPYGLVLLEAERTRITTHEPLQACVKAAIISPAQQEAVFHFQNVGEAKCYLNGVELTPTEAIQHSKMSPMFYSWMTPKQTYYSLPLHEGENQLVVITQPDYASGWWGLGGTVYDHAGNILI